MARQPELRELLIAAVEYGASDIHLTVGCPPVLRIDGELGFIDGLGLLEGNDTEKYAGSVLTDDQMQQMSKIKDFDVPLTIPGISRFRVNVFLQRGCMAMAVRVIPKDVPSLDKLGLPRVLRTLAEKPRGLVLVTGPTGVGKTTTLAAMIDFINKRRKAHIITIEDPIEYLFRHDRSVINQREVGADVSSFARGLRSVLREDPDVILVGEMRDPETTSTAITAAETGHLVMATVHTRDAASTIDRIIDQFPPHQQPQIRYMLAANLEGIVAQQLLPKKSGRGRVAAVEILIAEPGIRNLIREMKTHMVPAAIETGGGKGMQSMDQALRELWSQGLIDKSEAIVRAFNPAQLAKKLGGPS